MSSVTILPQDLPKFLEDNPVSLNTELLYTSPNGGGFKELSYGGQRLSIVVEGTVNKMKYEVKDRVAMTISEDTYNKLQILTNAIHSLGIETRGIAYKGDEGYEGFWLRGQLTGHEDRFFTKVYNKTDGEDYEEISIKDCPSSFRGYVCLEVRGVFIKSIKKKDSEIYLRNEFTELVIEEADVSTRGSKILDIIGGTLVKSLDSVTNYRNSEKSSIQDDEDLLW
eukprot:TRINITY_DN7436_c0_g1_i1.p1 TRINITY_DN7436_c0_g1~~TRINITY_DN7436_c0_g1_i1.p1  ORF type:complete len:224 (+),score=45.57 TRINITY_DN7436_c0_g1_i1:67-738(+)